nr:hypothetical protein Iba_chr13eCG9200 [Ipomoea batatas]
MRGMGSTSNAHTRLGRTYRVSAARYDMNFPEKFAKVEMDLSGKEVRQSCAWTSRVAKKPRHMAASLAPAIMMAARYMLSGKRKSLGSGSVKGEVNTF